MRAFQFWILMFSSAIVSLFYLKQIFLSHELNHQQRNLVEAQQVITEGQQYENAWKQMAMYIFQVGRQDAALTGILKAENVDVHLKATTPSGAAPTPETAPSAATKSPTPTGTP